MARARNWEKLGRVVPSTLVVVVVVVMVDSGDGSGGGDVTCATNERAVLRANATLVPHVRKSQPGRQQVEKVV